MPTQKIIHDNKNQGKQCYNYDLRGITNDGHLCLLK